MGEAFTRHSLRPLTFEGQANGKARTCQRRENDGPRVLFWLFDMQICAVVPDKRAERRITETHAPSLVAVLVSVSLDTLDSKGDLSRLSRTQQRRRPFSPLLPLDCLASTYRSDFRISRSAASRHRRLRHRGGGAARRPRRDRRWLPGAYVPVDACGGLRCVILKTDRGTRAARWAGYLHESLPILAHIIPPHFLDAGRLESLPWNEPVIEVRSPERSAHLLTC